MDYYEEHPIYRASSPQYKMIAAAIHAGETYQFVLHKPEEARPLYFSGMKMLNQTYVRRVNDWLNTPEPRKPPEDSMDTNDQQALERWEDGVRSRQECREAGKRGDVFRGPEPIAVESLVRHYVGTFGRVKPEDLSSILQPVVSAFPNSPFEKEARRVIRITTASVNAKGEK